MDAIKLLTRDHRTVEALFAQVKATSEAKHPELFKMIKGELDTHAHIEETMLYPRLEKGGKKELADITREGIEEHQQMHLLLAQLEALSGKKKERDTFEAKLKVLIENVEHHASEEEDEMFPLVEDRYSSETLEALGKEMEKEKKKFQKANGITPAPPAKSAIGSMIDQAVEVVTGMFGASSQQSGERAGSSKSGTRSAKASAGSTGSKSGSAATKSKASSSSKSASKAATKSTDGKPAAKSSSSKAATGKSTGKTSTASNGGTKSNPPRVAGNGGGEAKSAKSSSASSAKKTAAKSTGAGSAKAAAKPNSTKKTSPTKSNAKRTTRANAT